MLSCRTYITEQSTGVLWDVYRWEFITPKRTTENEPIFTKLTPSLQSFIKNASIEFHEHLSFTYSLVTDIRSQLDRRRTRNPHKVPLSYFIKKQIKCLHQKCVNSQSTYKTVTMVVMETGVQKVIPHRTTQ